MASLGSASIDLKLNRTPFDAEISKVQGLQLTPLKLAVDTKDVAKQIRQIAIAPIKVGVTLDLANLKIDPIKIDLAPNVDDFQEKLKRLGRISPIPIDFQIDSKGIAQSFNQIGIESRAGFEAGFAAREAGKQLGADLMGAVRDQLGIHSPSKVFEDIGQQAIAGLVSGLSKGSPAVKSVVSEVEDYFRKSNVELKVSVTKKGIGTIIKTTKSRPRKPRTKSAQPKKIAIADDALSTDIGKAIQKGFDKIKPSNIFNSLGSVITGPLDKIFTGFFEGLASPLGEQLGTGVSKGLQAKFGSNIGSLELIAQRATEKTLEAIPQAQKAVVEAIKANPIGAAIAKQLEILQGALEEAGVSLSPQKLIRNIVPEEQAQVTSSAIKFEGQQAEYEERKKAKASAGIDFLDTAEQIPQYQEITTQLNQAQARSKVLFQELTQAQEAIAQGVVSPGSVSALSSASNKLEIQLQEIASLKAAKEAFEEKLNEQIRLLANLGLGGNLPQQIAQKSELRNTFGELSNSQQIIEANTGSPAATAEINSLDAKISALNEQISGDIEALRSGVGKSLPTLINSALGKTPIPAAVAPAASTPAPLPPLPATYRQILDEVAVRSGVNIERGLVPTPIAADLPANVNAYYNPRANQIALSQNAYAGLQTGNITPQAVDDVVHELRHAIQTNFGQLTPEEKPAIDLISPTSAEIQFQSLGARIERSARSQPEALQPVARRLEADAYTFASRNAPEIYQGIQKQQAIQGFESQLGIGGAGANLQIKEQINAATRELKEYSALAQKYGIDIQQEMLSTVGRLEAIKKIIADSVSKIGNIEELPAEEIQSIQAKLQGAIASSSKLIQATIDGFKGSDKVRSLGQFENSGQLRQTLAENLNAEGIRDLARRMGINTQNSNKENLINDISAFGGSANLREQISGLIGTLSPDKFLQGAKLSGKSAPLAEAPEAIAQLKESRRALAQALKETSSSNNTDKSEILEQIAQQAQSQELLAKELSSQFQLTGKQGQSLGGIRSQLQAIASQAKAQLQEIGENLSLAMGEGILASAAVPEENMRQVAQGVEQTAKTQLGIQSPSRILRAIGNFVSQGLALGIESGIPLVEQASFKLLEAITNTPFKEAAPLTPDTIQSINAANLHQANEHAERFETRYNVLGDIQEDNEKQVLAQELAQNPDRRDDERERIRQQAKLSANLERKYGMEGFAPQILPPQITAEGEAEPEMPSVVDSIRNTFKSFNQNITERLRKRASQLAVDLETAIAPSLEVSAAQANERGDAGQQKQLLNLANQARTTASDIGSIVNLNEISERQYQELRKLTEQAEKVYDTIARPLPSENFIDQAAFGIKGLAGNLLEMAKGAIAFQAFFLLQNALRQVSVDAFNTYVQIDKLKTALDFASGGSGAQNLRFVRDEVSSLKIPLQASIEGFTQLAASTRNTVVEGKETRLAFQGLAEASTVLSLSGDETKGVIESLSKALSRGKINEDFIDEFGTRIPGALGIAARAMGVTEAQFVQLSRMGEINSSDFLSRFSRQLHAEFGQSASSASDNAQSAIFGLQNSFQDLQTNIGGDIAPVATKGINLLSAAIQGLADHSTELSAIAIALSSALIGRLLASLVSLAQQFILTSAAGGTFGGMMVQLARTLNTSPTAIWSVGIFSIIEGVHLLHDAIQTDLVQSFEQAGEAAQKAADDANRAFDKVGKKPGSASDHPQSSNWFGRAADSVIDFLNTDVGFIPGGVGGFKLRTYGEKESEESQVNLDVQAANRRNLITNSRLEIDDIKRGTGPDGGLLTATTNLYQAEESRDVLQAQIQRNYADKGLSIPANLKAQLDQETLIVRDLNDKRATLANNINTDLASANAQIGSIKNEMDRLDAPDALQVFGSQSAIEAKRGELKNELDNLYQIKAAIEQTLGSLHIDPVLAFEQSLRSLNLEFTKSAELIQNALAQGKITNTQRAVAGFATNRFASRDAALANAGLELSADQSEETATRQAYLKAQTEVNRPEFQSTLQRLGVSPTSTVAEITDIQQNSPGLDESDKSILEKLKSATELRQKYFAAQQTTLTARQSQQGLIQENATFNLDEAAANQKAALQIREDQATASFKRELLAKKITEEQANVDSAVLQKEDTAAQQRNLDQQLRALNAYHKAKIIGAEEYEKRSRQLLTEHSALEKQAAENDLAFQQAILQERLKAFEYANTQAEGAIALTQTTATTQSKSRQLAAGLNQPAQEEADLEQNRIDAQALASRTNLIREKMAQNRQLYTQGLRDERDFNKEKLQLNQDLAQNNQQLVENKIQLEEKYRQSVESDISRVVAAQENQFKLAEEQIKEQKDNLDLYNSSLERTAKLEESRGNLAKALNEAAIAPLDIQKNSADHALELSKRLQDSSTNPIVANAIRQQLAAAGFGTSEIAILNKRGEIEDEIFQKKLEGLKIEQEYQRRSLALELEKQKIAAQISIYDAQSGQLAAAKAKLEAESALKVAEVKKDDIGIQTAKIGIQLADKDAELADKKLQASQDNLGVQQELGRNAILAQEATQRTATEQEIAADNARRQSEALEKVEAIANQLGKGANTDNKTPKFKNQLERDAYYNFGILPGESGIDAANRQLYGTLKGENPFDAIMRQSFNIFKPGVKTDDQHPGTPLVGPNAPRQIVNIPSAVITPTPLPDNSAIDPNSAYSNQPNNNAGKIEPSEDKLENALRSANQDVVKKLDQVVKVLEQAYKSPRSLTVKSINPVEDTAKILNELSKYELQSTGL